MDTAELTEVGLGEIAFWSIVIIIGAVLAYLVYRSMNHPLIRISQTPDGPRVTRRNLVRYVIVTPILVTAWWLFFTVVLLVNQNELNAAQLLIFPIALIIAIRTLAFTAPRAGHELAKIIPIALVAFVILDGRIRDLTEIDELGDQAESIDVSGAALLLLFAYDYVLTAIWYWGWVRWGKPEWQARKERRSAEHVAHDDGGVAIMPDTDGADRGA